MDIEIQHQMQANNKVGDNQQRGEEQARHAPVDAARELANSAWQEMHNFNRNAAKPALEHVPINLLQNGEKQQLNTGHILTRENHVTSLGTAQFSQNPSVGWLMRFDKTGQLMHADGVKKVDSANGIATFRANDGTIIKIGPNGPLKITSGERITSFAPTPLKRNPDNALPELHIEGLNGKR